MRGAMVVAVCTAVIVSRGGVGQPGRADGEGDRPEKTVVIPRESIYLSHPDQNLYKGEGLDRASDKLYEDTLYGIKRGGPSNVILVSGDNFRAAVASTIQAYNSMTAGSATGDWVLAERDPKSFDLVPPRPGRRVGIWVVAYLGSGSDSDWSFVSVERTGTRVRVSFKDHTVEPGARVGNVRPNVIWAPLGPLEPGRYALELYETASREVKLTRSVEVKQ